MKATLPNGTVLEGTPDEIARFIDKPTQPIAWPSDLQPLPYIPNPAPVTPWPYIPSYPTIIW